jgi:chromatin segregation and condensation protein Rec8/ScpA/Scc1 (kleisin family)
VASINEDKAQLEERVDDLIERLKEARSMTNVEEAYKQEIRDQCYKTFFVVITPL